MISIADLDLIIKNTFGDSMVSSIKSVYELSDDEKFYKLVLSFHLLKYNDNIILHTKLLFKVDLDKKQLLNNSFGYLYDINCVYKYREFKDLEDLKTKLDAVFGGRDFGKDIKNLSEFMTQAATSINMHLNKQDIDTISVFEVIYNPKFKITTCKDTEFNFDINVSNSYKVDLNLKKISDKQYIYVFKIGENVNTVETETLSNIPVVISNGLVDLMKNITESKETDF